MRLEGEPSDLASAHFSHEPPREAEGTKQKPTDSRRKKMGILKNKQKHEKLQGTSWHFHVTEHISRD
jgi:hypothetical protein